MPPAHGGDRTPRPQGTTVAERKPDYFIGSSGLPTLTSPSVKLHGGGATDGVRNSKLNKCLYNTALRNGAAAGGPGTTTTSVGHTGAIVVGSGRSCKTESDITAIKPSTTGRYSKSPSPSTVTVATLSSAPGCPQRFGHARGGCTAADAVGRTTGSLPGGWPSPTTVTDGWRSRSSSSTSPTFTLSSSSNIRPQKTTCPPPRLLGSRSNMQPASSTTTTRPNRPQEGRLMVSQQCRYSNLHRQLDNRLTYQRSYDRNIFGYDQRMDQFVLPPLQS